MKSPLPPAGGVGGGPYGSPPTDPPLTPPASGRGITLAVIIGAHGVTGEVRLKLFGEGPDSLKRHKNFDAGAKTLTLKQLRPGNNGAIARFAEINDRNAAEALKGTELTVARETLPPLEEGEYYHTDLLGLACVSPDGDSIGTIVAVENFGAGDIIEIELPAVDGKKPKRVMVPLRTEAVPEWDAARAIVNPDWLD